MRLTEQQYGALAAACDRLLRAPATSLARLAIPALHLLNEHPRSLAQYTPVYAERAPSRLAGMPRTVLRAARGLVRSLGAPSRIDAASGPVDVLIVSHLLRHEQLEHGTDFYFGRMLQYFQEQGVRAVLAFVDHRRAGGGVSLPRVLPADRVILPSRAPLASEVQIWRQCLRAAKDLRSEAAAAANAIGSGLALLASRQATGAATVANLRLHAAVARLCAELTPRIVITTYEGTVAERLVWHAARTARQPPLCVGYQHALVLRRAHAIRRPVAAQGLACDPDVVLTLGPVPHIALAASPALQATRFIEYGSHRRIGLPALPPWHDRPRRCLVLPDAGETEAAILFGFALQCAMLSPDTAFVLRPHPMADLSVLLRRIPELRRLPGNASISKGAPLQTELTRARYCLYRGSSAALYAVCAGIKPFYLSRPDELSFDCLHDLVDRRETVSTPRELIEALHRADSFPDAASAEAAALCSGYVSAVRPAALQALFSHDIVRSRSAEMRSGAAPAR